MHILYQMTCLSWVISSTFSNPERRYTTENIMTLSHNVTRNTENSRAITMHKGNGEKTTSQDDEDKKTLAQQVADGKYGLIQKELFLKPAKRPGIISYEINPEVPKDNINNLGGLEPEEIWLAENHLLVLKGGSFSSSKNHRGNSVWPAIDDYVAPKRQVKIPSNPKIPPPFPVQLKDGGPIQFIKPSNDSVSQLYPQQTADDRNNSKQINMTRNNGIPLFPASLFIPPGSGFPSALKNITELDEDDPRIYYPPPYDFLYSKDNLTTQVPPGPLVPGIILPPPPDFFALLQPHNNRSTVKPTRKPERPRTIIPYPRNKTTTIHLNKNTKNTPQVKVLNHESPTRAGNKNEQLQHTNREEMNNGWIPIPGHSHTTDIKPPTVTEHSMKGHYVPDNVRLYKNITRFYPVNDGRNHYFEVYNNSPKPEYYADIKDGQYYSTTPLPFQGFHPLILNLPDTLRPTMPPIYPYPFTLTKDKKLKETYIIYGDRYIDPNIDSYQQTTKKPLKQYLENEQKNINYEANTPLNPKLYNEPIIKVTQSNAKEYPKELPYYDQTYKKATHQSEPSFQYVYYNNNKPKDGGYAYDIPIKLQSHYEQHDIGIYNVQNVRNHKMNHQVHPTTKTPIYEYSFSAPGYGTVEAPKISTTPKPNVFENTFTPIKRPQYAFFEYQTTPKNANSYRYDHSTNAPKLYTTLKPNFERNNGYSTFHTVFRTENPFNPYFTHDTEMMDDMGKKYLNTFGQKLNNADINKPLTTSLPPQNNQRKPYYQEPRPGTNNPPNNKEDTIKFDHGNYNIQSDKAYYEKPNNYQQDPYKFSISKPQHNTETIKYPQIYSTLPNFEHYDYEPDIVRPNHPLTSDINVNYKSPPPLNPEAEFIDPQYSNHENSRDNTYISYQLPGSGGHFYFLTPRSIRAENYHLANSGFQYPNSENTDHYQNTPHRVRRRKRPQKST